MVDENKIIENNEEINFNETTSTKEEIETKNIVQEKIEVVKELEKEPKEEVEKAKPQKNKKEKPTKLKKKRTFKSVFCLYGTLISVILLIVSGYLFYSKYFERNELGIKEKTYVNVNENGIKTSIKIKGDSLTFLEFDFKESYETMALMSLAKNMGVEFNKLNQAEQDELIEIEVNKMIKGNVFKRNTPYQYTYDKKSGIITITNGGRNLTFVYEEFGTNKFLKTPRLTLFNYLYE